MGQLRDENFFGVLDSTGIVITDDLWSSKDQSKGFDHKATYYNYNYNYNYSGITTDCDRGLCSLSVFPVMALWLHHH